MPGSERERASNGTVVHGLQQAWSLCGPALSRGASGLSLGGVCSCGLLRAWSLGGRESISVSKRANHLVPLSLPLLLLVPCPGELRAPCRPRG
jgi:hypothetical protein